MTEIAGRGVCFVGEGKRFFDGIKKSFTLPYTDCHLEPIVSFLTTNRITSHERFFAQFILERSEGLRMTAIGVPSLARTFITRIIIQCSLSLGEGYPKNPESCKDD